MISELVLYKRSEHEWQWVEEAASKNVGPVHTTEQAAVQWVNNVLIESENDLLPYFEKEVINT